MVFTGQTRAARVKLCSITPFLLLDMEINRHRRGSLSFGSSKTPGVLAGVRPDTAKLRLELTNADSPEILLQPHRYTMLVSIKLDRSSCTNSLWRVNPDAWTVRRQVSTSRRVTV